MSLQVGKAIYNILSNDAKVIDGVGHKIYPLIAVYIVKILMWKWL